jgi:hypothetical protein
MNDLSWLIYLADIAGSVGGLLIFLTVIAGTAAVVSLIVAFAAAVDDYLEIAAAARRIFRQALPACIACGLIAGFIPDRQTVMMIAASEIGQRAVNSPNVAAVVDPSLELLKAWIAKTTADLKKQ